MWAPGEVREAIKVTLRFVLDSCGGRKLPGAIHDFNIESSY